MSLINLGHQGQPGSLDTSLFSTNTIPSSSILTSTANITNGVVILDSLDRLPIADGSRLLHVSASGINGITVTGTPSSGQVLTATSSIAADWQTPSSGGTPAGSTGAIQFSSNGVTFASDPAHLFWDISNQRLGIGTPTPNSPLNILVDENPFGVVELRVLRQDVPTAALSLVVSDSLAHGGGELYECRTFNTQPNDFAGVFRVIAIGGTESSPTATPAGALLNLGFGGHNGSAEVGTKARVQLVAEQLWAPGNTPTRIQFATTKSGHTNIFERLRITHDGAIQFTNPGQGGPAVSDANTGRIYYDSGSQTFQVSQNGGAYSPLAFDLSNVPSNINVTDGHEYQIGGARAVAGSNRSEGLCVGNAGPADLLAGSNNNNTYVGNSAGASIDTGNHNNVFLGANAGISQTGGDNNTYLGTQAGSDNNGSNNVFLGAGAGNGETSSSSRLFIAAKSSPFSPSGGALIYGEFDNNRVGIGQASATCALDVLGQQQLTSYSDQSQLLLTRFNGTPGSPTTIVSGDSLFNLASQGFDGTNQQGGARIRVTALETWAPGSHGSRIEFDAVANGTNAPSTVATISSTGLNVSGDVISVAGPAAGMSLGGADGIFTINANSGTTPFMHLIANSDSDDLQIWFEEYPNGVPTAPSYGWKLRQVHHIDPGTPDFLLFASTGSTFNNNVLSLDPSGKMGVNTTNPAYTLDVAGDVNVSGMYRVGGVQIASTNLSDGTTLTAASLKDSGGSVNVSSAAAPSTGQVLTATDATHATWQTPSAGTSAAGITGSVQFKSGGTFAANTANFFWDDGNTGLGVRTTSLFGGNGSASDGGTTALHVAGPSVFGGSIWVDGPNGIELTGGGTLHGSTGVPFGSDITVKGGASTSNGPGALILLQGSQASSGSKVSLRSSNGSNSTLESEFTIFGNDGGGGSNSFFFNAKTDFGSPTSPAYKFATGSNSEKMRLTFQGHLLVGTTTDSGYFISAAGDINSSTLYRIGGAPVLAVAGFSSNSILVGLQANSVGNQNVLLGYQVANGGNGTGNENVFIGYESAYFNSGGNFNTFVGASTGQGFGSVGEYNTYVGYESGLGQSGTTHNTFLGANSGRNSTGSAGSVFIGYKAGYSEVRSNKLYITNDDVPPLIYGEFDTNRVSIGGLTTSAYTLDVAGDINTSGVFRVNGTPISNPSFVDKETPSGTINSSNTVFTLAFTPTSNSEHVFLNGLLQDGGGNDYSITGPTITFTVAPTTGSRLRVSYRK